MTEIPGTAMPKSPQTSKPPLQRTKLPLANLPVHENEQQVVNTQESKRTDSKQTEGEENLLWYQTLLAWMSFGTILGVLASIVGLRVANLVVLSPLGPTVGAIAWYVRKLAKKHLKKFDSFTS